MNFLPLIHQIKSCVKRFSDELNSGATDAEVNGFMQRIDLEIPREFIEFYKVCNGTKDQFVSTDVEGFGLLSLECIIRSKNIFDTVLKEKEDKNEFFMWSRDWLPFASNYSYDDLVIDTTGKETGRKGCVLKFSKDSFESDLIKIVACDFKTYILQWHTRIMNEQVYHFNSFDNAGKNADVTEHSYTIEYVAATPFSKTNIYQYDTIPCFSDLKDICHQIPDEYLKLFPHHILQQSEFRVQIKSAQTEFYQINHKGFNKASQNPVIRDSRFFQEIILINPVTGEVSDLFK